MFFFSGERARVINAFFVLRCEQTDIQQQMMSNQKENKIYHRKNIRREPAIRFALVYIHIHTQQMVIFYPPSCVDTHITYLVHQGRVHYVELIRFDVVVFAYIHACVSVCLLTYFSPICGLFSLSIPLAPVHLSVIGVSLNEFLCLHLQNRYIIVCDKMRF